MAGTRFTRSRVTDPVSQFISLVYAKLVCAHLLCKIKNTLLILGFLSHCRKGQIHTRISHENSAFHQPKGIRDLHFGLLSTPILTLSGSHPASSASAHLPSVKLTNQTDVTQRQSNSYM